MPINQDGSLSGVESRSSVPTRSVAPDCRPEVYNQLTGSPMQVG